MTILFINVRYNPWKALLVRVSFFKVTINLPSVFSTPIVYGMILSNVPNLPLTVKIGVSFVTFTVVGILIGNFPIRDILYIYSNYQI